MRWGANSGNSASMIAGMVSQSHPSVIIALNSSLAHIFWMSILSEPAPCKLVCVRTVVDANENQKDIVFFSLFDTNKLRELYSDSHMSSENSNYVKELMDKILQSIQGEDKFKNEYDAILKIKNNLYL